DVLEVEQHLAPAEFVNQAEQLFSDHLDILLVEDLLVDEVDDGNVADVLDLEAAAAGLRRHKTELRGGGGKGGCSAPAAKCQDNAACGFAVPRRRPRARARRTICPANSAHGSPAATSDPASPDCGLNDGFGFTSRMYGFPGDLTRKSTRA